MDMEASMATLRPKSYTASALLAYTACFAAASEPAQPLLFGFACPQPFPVWQNANELSLSLAAPDVWLPCRVVQKSRRSRRVTHSLHLLVLHRPRSMLRQERRQAYRSARLPTGRSSFLGVTTGSGRKSAASGRTFDTHLAFRLYLSPRYSSVSSRAMTRLKASS